MSIIHLPLRYVCPLLITSYLPLDLEIRRLNLSL
jgi:hypothetical protein